MQISLYDHEDSKFWPLDKPGEVYYEESTHAPEGPRQTIPWVRAVATMSSLFLGDIGLVHARTKARADTPSS
jgi:hypothetical protein